MPPESKTVTEIDGHRLTLTNLAKVLYPDAGFTKAAVIDYYARIAPVLLPHLAGRALTMVRWPDGVTGPSFFEKRCPPHAPKWVRTGSGYPGVISCVVDDTASLVWAANLAALELHTLQARVDDPDHPTSMVLDLDPGAPAGLLDCCAVALELRGMLDDLGLVSVVKSSGSKGLHVAVPTGGRDRGRDEGRRAGARAAARVKRDPERVTVLMNRDLRAGQGVRRLEPERPAQDDGVRVLVARPAAAAGVGSALVGRGRGRARIRGRDAASCSRPRRCSNASRRSATCTTPT